MSKFKVGDKVKLHLKGSWIDNAIGTIEALNVTSSDEIAGHRIKMDGIAMTVASEEQLEKLPDTQVAEAAKRGFNTAFTDTKR